MIEIEKFISPLIRSQFPSFYEEDGGNFISFVQAYYEWLELTGNPVGDARSLFENVDIDFTSEQYLTHFKNTFIAELPENILADKRLLIKHITELYTSKGTPKSYEFLFRILFNEAIQIYLPGDHLFATSDNTWIVPKYIEVSDSFYWNSLNGKKIYSNSGSAIVESFTSQLVNGRSVNVVYLSSLVGHFRFGEQVFCDDLYTTNIYKSRTTGIRISLTEYNALPTGSTSDYFIVASPSISLYEYNNLSNSDQANYSLALDYNTAPIVFGSLSSIGIIDGGYNFKVGDILNVKGSGINGKARVASIRNENGKVFFNLQDGGKGFTANAVITVTGGFGTGASFAVGGLVDKTIYRVYTDIIQDHINTQLDIDSQGYILSLANSTGAFTNGEFISTSANGIVLDVTPLTGTLLKNAPISNTTLGISGLTSAVADGSYVILTGNNTSLLNANIAVGITLNDNNGSSVRINAISSKGVTTFRGYGTASAANTSYVNILNMAGNHYFFPGETITGNTSGKTATITTVVNNTDWVFPNSPNKANLDSPINQVLNTEDLVIGTIEYLTNINPGKGYSANPNVSIIEPYIYQLQIPDGKGGYWGQDAVVTATASNANGIATSAEVYDAGFGYSLDENVYLVAETSNSTQTSIKGSAVVQLNGFSSGYWQNNKSFLSDTNYLQDSNYYQKFSYEIVSSRLINTYENYVKKLIHPAGIKMFGRFYSYNALTENPSTPMTFSLQQQTP